MMMSLADLRARIFFGVLAGYIILSYGFMQLRLPPGIPIGDLSLILCLATINIPVVLNRIGGVVNLMPFLVWWSFGLGRALFDSFGGGLWALRDAAHVIESLFLIVAFVVIKRTEDVERLFRWLKVMFIVTLICTIADPTDFLGKISPTVPAATNGDPIPVIGSFANQAVMLLWIAFYLMITDHKNQLVRIAAVPTACLLIGFVVIALQARTTYFQLFALVCILWLFRPRSLGRFGMALPVMFVVLGMITAFNIKIPGRITDEVSFEFVVNHVEAIAGISEEGDPNLAGAASGVPQRLGWWSDIMKKELADDVKLLIGLGYGEPLVNFRYTSGAVVREPHNSFISVLGRLGIIGAISWIWLHIELFKVWRKAFVYYRRIKDLVGINRLLILLAFAALVLMEAIGEDALEKPYNIVPYYCFWGVVLRLGFNIPAAYKPALPGAKYHPG